MSLDAFITEITTQLNKRESYLFRTERLADETILDETKVYVIPESYKVITKIGGKVYEKVPGELHAVVLCPRRLSVGTHVLVHLMYGVQTVVSEDKTEPNPKGIIALVMPPLTKETIGNQWNITPYVLLTVENNIITSIGYSNSDDHLRRTGMALASTIGLYENQDVHEAIAKIAQVYLRAHAPLYTLSDMRLPKTI